MRSDPTPCGDAVCGDFWTVRETDLVARAEAAEARIEAVEAERDELHRLVWRTKDALIAALTGEADE